jgi:hypothetical protein
VTPSRVTECCARLSPARRLGERANGDAEEIPPPAPQTSAKALFKRTENRTERTLTLRCCYGENGLCRLGPFPILHWLID